MVLLRTICLLIAFLLVPFTALSDTRIDPAYETPDYVRWLLEAARSEIGYQEGAHGYTKYGEWAGDPYAQWCAEFLCWCVHQVDEEHGTHLLNEVYPMYSASNVGKQWFIDHGRYIVRWGNLEGWGYQWLKGDSSFITTGTYIPQPGDWVFFTWTSDLNTDHVAMVEYCTRDQAGNVQIHVIEGNTPSSVKRETYALTYSRILGFGTVHDVADWTMRSGNSGEKVRQLQTKLAKIGYLTDDLIDGKYGSGTAAAVTSFQDANGLRPNGIANIATQHLLTQKYVQKVNEDPMTWLVEETGEEDPLDFTFDDLFSQDHMPEEELTFEAEDVIWSEESAPDEDSSMLLTDELPLWVQEP